MELKLKEVLTTIEQIEKSAKKLFDLLPDDYIMEATPKGMDSLIDVRGLAIDVSRAIKLASAAILRIKGVIDEQEAEI